MGFPEGRAILGTGAASGSGPGGGETPATCKLKAAGPVERDFISMYLLGHAGQPEEAACIARFPLSEEVSVTAGAHIPVDGGFASAHLLSA